MKKGDIVLVHAVIEAGYCPENFVARGAQIVYCPEGDSSKTRGLYRWIEPSPWQGMVVGTSYRATGHYNAGQVGSFNFDDSGDPPYLREDDRHPVIMVQPLNTSRWLKPIPCLERDLEGVVEHGNG